MAQVITVCGPKSPDELGLTMMHVHLLVSISVSEQKELTKLRWPPTASDEEIASRPITLDMLGTIRRHIYLCWGKIVGDIDEVINELMFYKRIGGTTIVECTPVGIGRDPIGLRKVSGATGINVVCTTGFYIAASHSEFVKTSSIDQLCDHMVRELTTGIGLTGVRAGLIKAACSGATPNDPFSGSEEKVLRAAARAQAKTGASLTIHPCHHRGLARHWHTYIDILEEEGANLEKCYMSHMEFWHEDTEYQKSVLDRGVSVGFDQFGNEYYHEPGLSYPNDRMREDSVVKLVKAGYANRIVLSNEVLWKISLRKYGGYGYAHVLENTIPDLRFYGVTEDQINTMLVENPKRLLPF